MGLFLYRIVLSLYIGVIRLIAFFHKKAKAFLTGRKDIFKKLASTLEKEQSIVWFHCASLGEFEQGRPVMEKIKALYPKYSILVTFFSPSGYEPRKNHPIADYVFYLPMDSKKNAKRFFDIVQPSLIFWVKYEFWFFYIKEAYERNVPFILFSAVFTPKQIFFRRYHSFSRSMLRMITHIFVQDNQSLSLLKSIDIAHCSLAGDTRFDRVVQTTKNAIEVPIVESFIEEKKLMILGSTWPEDVRMIKEFVENNDLKYIIAPHEINDAEIRKQQKLFTKKSTKLSEANLDNIGNYDILFVDNIGLLASLYQYAHFAYIGGGLGRGLHNILEAATFGMPIFFGNISYHAFVEANDLIKKGVAFAVGNSTALQKRFDVFSDENYYHNIVDICKRYVQENVGATDTIMCYVKGLIKTD